MSDAPDLQGEHGDAACDGPREKGRRMEKRRRDVSSAVAERVRACEADVAERGRDEKPGEEGRKA
jgi:hypothetical protein